MSWDENDRCGVGIFSTSEKDPLTPACVVHDKEYVAHDNGDTRPRSEIDAEFLANSLKIAGGNKWLKARAYLYYGIVRTLGGIFF